MQARQKFCKLYGNYTLFHRDPLFLLSTLNLNLQILFQALLLHIQRHQSAQQQRSLCIYACAYSPPSHSRARQG